MRSSHTNVLLLAMVGLLLFMLYPAGFPGNRLAPEMSLKSKPPWRMEGGPYPNPSPSAVEAATHLGPRLACIARDGFQVALWNPLIGGGRPGWLSSPAEGGAPLPVIAALLARPGWAWTALLALQLTVAFMATWWALSLLGLAGWPAAVGAAAYALSGPVSGHWLDWQGSAMAFGPLALVPVLAAPPRWQHRAAAWAAVMTLLVASGAPAAQFIALALALAVVSPSLLGRPARWGALALAAVIALALMLPVLWLERAGGEPGALPPAAQRVSPPTDLGALVAPQTLPDQPGTAPVATPAYIGLATLVLAALGVGAMGFRARGFWLGVFAVSLALAMLPGPTLARAGIPQRAFGVLALAAAVLAAHGAQALCNRVNSPIGRHAAGSAAWLMVVLALAPFAAHRLPFAPAEDVGLAVPIPSSPPAEGTRVVGILGMLPPDASAALGIADVRASSFRREPRYASLLGAERDGELSVSRALDTRTARLSARWLLEPLPLRVVSGEVFGRIEPSELYRRDERPPDGLRRYAAQVPRGACRIGLRAALPPASGWLERAGHRTQLEPDGALAAESDAWHWYALPPGWPAGPATLALPAHGGPDGSALAVAWDASGLRLAREEHGTRVWLWDAARPLAFLATGVQADGGDTPTEATVVTVAPERVRVLQALGDGSRGVVRVAASTPSSLDVIVDSRRASLLAVQLKFRPALWVVTVNGRLAKCEPVDGVWTGVMVPAGHSLVHMRVHLPFAVWFSACSGLVALGVLALPRRKR